MANIKNAKKRIKTSKTKTARNQIRKSNIKMYMKQIEALVKAGDKAGAQKKLIEATKAIDRAAYKGVFHKKNAAHKVSRLQKSVNKI